MSAPASQPAAVPALRAEAGVLAPGPGSAPAALRAEALVCRYGSAEVFAEASFVLEAGEVAFLTGPNGAGKSTLLRCLAGWDAPGEGRVEVCGRRFDGSDRALRSLVAFVPDVPSFYDDLAAGEHLRFVQRANRLAPEDDPAEELLERFGLERCRDLLPSSYSRGVRQKLALVLAFARRPRVLLLDEPYGPLDPGAALVLSALLDEVRAAGTAVLASCHHDVPDLAPDALMRLEGGRLSVERPAAGFLAGKAQSFAPQREGGLGAARVAGRHL